MRPRATEGQRGRLQATYKLSFPFDKVGLPKSVHSTTRGRFFRGASCTTRRAAVASVRPSQVSAARPVPPSHVPRSVCHPAPSVSRVTVHDTGARGGLYSSHGLIQWSASVSRKPAPAARQRLQVEVVREPAEAVAEVLCSASFEQPVGVEPREPPCRRPRRRTCPSSARASACRA